MNVLLPLDRHTCKRTIIPLQHNLRLQNLASSCRIVHNMSLCYVVHHIMLDFLIKIWTVSHCQRWQLHGQRAYCIAFRAASTSDRCTMFLTSSCRSFQPFFQTLIMHIRVNFEFCFIPVTWTGKEHWFPNLK